MPFASGPSSTRIYYDVVGDEPGAARPTVVLIQGLGLSSRFWFDLPQRLSQGPRPRRVVILDNRGTGRSDKPQGRYKMTAMADDVAAVLDAARIEHASVVGISLGGMVAQHVALRHPRRVSGLVLMATTAGVPHARLPKMRAVATLVSLPVLQRVRGPAQVGRSLARLLLSEKDVPRARELLAHWPAAMRAEPMSPRTYFAQLAAVLGHSTGFRLKRIACPTVVVTGDDDVLIPPHNSRAIARLVPGAHLEVLRACGHAIPASDPDCVQRALDRLSGQILSAPVRKR
jgi:3-oxoadipate enol-lactonase